MGNFKLVGRVEHIGPRDFVAIAAAVPDQPGAMAAIADIRLEILPDREGAMLTRDILLKDLGEALRLRGDRVVDVETDD